MSDTGSNDPYDPNRPQQPPEPPQSPQSPPWGSTPPPPPSGGEWTGGQLSSQGYGQPQYGQPEHGQPEHGQPQYGQPQYGQPPGSPPPNYLVWSILSTLFCCLPLGIVSIVFAAQVNSKHSAGDIAGAQEASRKAKQFAIWSAAVGLVVAVIYLVAVVALAGAGSA